MWITKDGVVHTVSPSDWRTVILLDVDDLATPTVDSLNVWIEDFRQLVYEQIAAGTLHSGPVRGLPSSQIEVEVEKIDSVVQFSAWLARVPDMWKLDALDALELALEEWQEDQVG